MKQEVLSGLNDLIDKYGEWIEMSEDPELFLIELLATLLHKEKEENKALRKIAYLTNNLSRN